VLGEQHISLTAGDHIWFAAGKEEAHHIENSSDAPFQFLVFGERNPQNVVVYPDNKVMMVKGLGFRQVTYRPVIEDED